MENKLSSVKLLGTNITTASESEILEYIITRLEKKSKKFYIVTPNPEILMFAKSHPDFQEVLNHAKIALPDGVGVVKACRILTNKIIGRITGVDMMEKLCQEISKRTITVGFLGGKGNVAEKTAECLTRKYPGLRVVFSGEEWNIADRGPVVAPPPSDILATHSVRAAGDRRGSPSASHPFVGHIDILFVAFGFPKQEEWIAQNLESLPVTAAMGVGGAFDYISGKIPRAPKIVRSAGLEWAFRLARQPWRIKRQLVLPQFVAEVMKEKLKDKK